MKCDSCAGGGAKIVCIDAPPGKTGPKYTLCEKCFEELKKTKAWKDLHVVDFKN